MAKPKLSDVWWMSATLRPVTTCRPPEGKRCHLEGGSVWLTGTEAKRHALENPGHHVTREARTVTEYRLDPPEDGA